jgi:hypothetical protein
MKKRIIFISLLLVMVFVCSACDGNVTRDLRHDGFAVSTKFECDIFYPKNKEDTSYKKIKYLTENNIIDSTGKIYEVSLGGVYVNKKNCKSANTSIYVKAIFDDKIVKSTDNKYYYLVGENSVSSYSEVPTTDNSYELYNLLLKENDVVKAVTADSSSGVYYVLKTDGNVYSYNITKASYNAPLKIVSTSIAYDKSDYDSKIIDFKYAGEASSTYIRTEDSLYRMKITNYDKCSKYVDIDCKYNLEEDTTFNKYKDRIIAFNGSVLITDYKQIFTVSN